MDLEVRVAHISPGGRVSRENACDSDATPTCLFDLVHSSQLLYFQSTCFEIGKKVSTNDLEQDFWNNKIVEKVHPFIESQISFVS